ncbi:hypothetical protein mRhiFer1_009490 [Rhinolophus ferrumequinum]|uniref:Uncharacterized protein n=1 Tax=Rhinolophus ferrumequinum TaxID=59479 RepID=A0A7J7RFA8_RHIFE|nr:hypothetical protein mRhiFer1_009490 [Rhinolophus ferrumequinum]
MPKRKSVVTVRSYVPCVTLTIVSQRVLKALRGQNGMKGEKTDVCFLLVWGFSLLCKSKTLHHPGHFSPQPVTAHGVRAITSAEPARPAPPRCLWNGGHVTGQRSGQSPNPKHLREERKACVFCPFTATSKLRRERKAAPFPGRGESCVRRDCCNDSYHVRLFRELFSYSTLTSH